MNNLNELYEAILAGKLEQAVSVTREAVAGGAAPQEIINEYMIKAMEAKPLEHVLNRDKCLFRTS